MGMSTGGSGISGGRRRRGGKRHAMMSEINVTPFVDVMLVLLIIFMVAAPLLTVGVPIDLPETQAKALNSETQPISISVNEQGQVYLQETEIPMNEIVAKLTAIAKNGYEERIYVRGDKTADYGAVMRVMGLLSQAGYKKLAMVTLQDQNN
jgi:biopolymer transport protein TolR